MNRFSDWDSDTVEVERMITVGDRVKWTSASSDELPCHGVVEDMVEGDQYYVRLDKEMAAYDDDDLVIASRAELTLAEPGR